MGGVDYPHFAALLSADQNFLDYESDEYSTFYPRSLICCRIVAITVSSLCMYRASYIGLDKNSKIREKEPIVYKYFNKLDRNRYLILQNRAPTLHRLGVQNIPVCYLFTSISLFVGVFSCYLHMISRI